jgi:carboxyl-terminal processing protease
MQTGQNSIAGAVAYIEEVVLERGEQERPEFSFKPLNSLLPAGTAEPSGRRLIALVRDTVKLTDEEAKAEIIDRVLPDGGVRRLGWIRLPSFYQDPAKFGMGKSASRDVAALVSRLNKEKIQGLIVDLRSNGGSLDEAVRMSGLFINQGPVVQIKDVNGNIDVLGDHERKALYTKPMIVLVDKLSASASEIFAAAMQDYGRALIVGDSSTFGKRDRPDHSRTGAIYALTWLILGWRSLKTDRAEVFIG